MSDHTKIQVKLELPAPTFYRTVALAYKLDLSIQEAQTRLIQVGLQTWCAVFLAASGAKTILSDDQIDRLLTLGDLVED